MAGVTTIAGGKMVRGGGHVDGPSEDAKFSNDFDVVYLGSSCSLLVIDRGNQAIREIQLHFDDCADQYGSGFPLGNIYIPKFSVWVPSCILQSSLSQLLFNVSLIQCFNIAGIAVLVAAVFFGYMLALLQRRLSSIVSYHTVSVHSHCNIILLCYPIIEL